MYIFLSFVTTHSRLSLFVPTPASSLSSPPPPQVLHQRNHFFIDSLTAPGLGRTQTSRWTVSLHSLCSQLASGQSIITCPPALGHQWARAVDILDGGRQLRCPFCVSVLPAYVCPLFSTDEETEAGGWGGWLLKVTWLGVGRGAVGSFRFSLMCPHSLAEVSVLCGLYICSPYTWIGLGSTFINCIFENQSINQCGGVHTMMNE